jgi:hypothetical protein
MDTVGSLVRTSRQASGSGRRDQMVSAKNSTLMVQLASNSDGVCACDELRSDTDLL